MAHGRQFNWPKTSVLVVLIVLVVTSLSAKTSDYLTDVWTSDNGLPDSSVTSIAQTPDGYLWIGTYNGLARFDGVRFVTFDPINTPALKNARITRLSVDAWGALWINTYDGSMTSLRNGVFTPEWQGGQVYSVFSFSNQVLLSLAGHHATIVYRTGLGSQHSEWKNMPLAGQVTGNSIEKDGSGTIWYTVKKDLYRMTGTNSEIMTSATGYRGKLVTCMSVDRGGNFWIGTDEGIARWNHGQFEDQTPTNGEPGVSVSTLYNTRNGCWVFANGKAGNCVPESSSRSSGASPSAGESPAGSRLLPTLFCESQPSLPYCDTCFIVNEDAALLNRHVTHMTPPHFSAAVYISAFPFVNALGKM